MKENVNRFLEKAAADQTLAEKLAALQEQYFAQLVTLAKEYGFELTPEDFAESVSPIRWLEILFPNFHIDECRIKGGCTCQRKIL